MKIFKYYLSYDGFGKRSPGLFFTDIGYAPGPDYAMGIMGTGPCALGAQERGIFFCVCVSLGLI